MVGRTWVDRTWVDRRRRLLVPFAVDVDLSMFIYVHANITHRNPGVGRRPVVVVEVVVEMVVMAMSPSFQSSFQSSPYARAKRMMDDACAIARDARTRPWFAALAVVAAMAWMKPPPEAFYAHCVRARAVRRTVRDVVFAGAISPTWVCSNSGASALVRKAAFTCHDGVVATACRTRDGEAFVGALGTWIRVPFPLDVVVNALVHVIRVNNALLSLASLGVVGVVAMKTLKALKLLALGVFGAAAVYFGFPRYAGVPRWSIALTAGLYYLAYRKHLLDGVLRVAKAMKPPPPRRHR